MFQLLFAPRPFRVCRVTKAFLGIQPPAERTFPVATKSLLVTELEEWGGVKCGSGGTAFSQPMRRQRDRVSVKALGIKFTGQGRPVLGRLVRIQIQGRVVVAISHLSSQSVCSGLLKRWGCPGSTWGGTRSHRPLPALCTPTSCFENCCYLIQGSMRCVPQTSTFMPRVPRAPAPLSIGAAGHRATIVGSLGCLKEMAGHRAEDGLGGSS